MLQERTGAGRSSHYSLRVDGWGCLVLFTPMQRHLFPVLAVVGSLSAGPLDHRPPGEVEAKMEVERVCFGSCARQNADQPMWERVVEREPDLFIWLGDNIYGDSRDMMVIAAKYLQLAEKPGYRKLVEQCPVVATWDDHDYGVNDGGRDYPAKEFTKRLMLDFYSEPEGSARRETPGIYTSHLLGPPERRVQVILLDGRWWRTKQTKGPKPPYERLGRYVKDDSKEATMLGEEQWDWLEGELGKPAKLRLIGTGSQFGSGWNGFEGWSNYPREKQRMFDLIKETKAAGVVFLSGDTHWAELDLVEEEGVYPIYDLTSSSINQAYPPGHPRNRVGAAHGVPNFGEVGIDWEKGVVDLNVRGIDGGLLIEQQVPLERLTFAEGNLEPSVGIEGALGKWQSDFGEMEISREGEKWMVKYPKGVCELIAEGRVLEGTWNDGETSGKCRFELTRDGKNLLGGYGRRDGPVLLNWSGWREE